MADNEQNAEVAQMKMVKFKATVERLQKYLWPYRSSSSVPCVPVGPEWLSYVDNPYINMLVAESIFSRCEMGNNVYGYVQNNSFSISKPNATGSSYYDIRVPSLLLTIQFSGSSCWPPSMTAFIMISWIILWTWPTSCISQKR